MEIKWLKTFMVAAKYENFRKTSEELFLTQPAITKHIRRLEENLNIELFDRNGKTISLTSAGFNYLPYAREIVEKYEQGLADFESWKQGYNRKLIIAAAPQIASSVLPVILRCFMDENPNIEVFINVLKSYEIGEEISAGRADLGLTRIKPFQTNINCHIVHEEPVILVGPHEDKVKSDDEKILIEKYRVITHNHPDYWENLLNEIKRHYPTVRTMKVNQIEITKRFIEQGLGISYLPYTMVRDELRMNKLIQIKSDQIHLPTSSTYVLTKVETNEANIFIRFFKEEMAKI
ncbi:LysR family transcriptional regulator [Peribacillus loiseleuriae]|uniref:Transcriptional regulator n=1 Tax=Peribacillus loiseleuriae TaxID=1679170 RepID=A0A0K9GV62_9BACI|nr:LysR family transcriptional regulator [Peribacillus loiseleuriae]KMY50513.1 transcriptional regulator [Peribacillus loiseleuriae]